MSFPKWLCVAVFAALLTLSTPVLAQTASPTNTQAAPVDILAGDDGWATTLDNQTFLDYSANPLPAGFFGPGSLAFSQKVSLSGRPIANSAGLAWHTDTIVRRLNPTGLLAVGNCADISIEFVSLHVESPAFTVNFSDGHTEQWKIVGGLSTAAAQPIGTMTICRTCNDGGTFDASLPALFVLYYQRVSPLPTVQRITDCGLSQCPQALFQSVGEDWTLAGGPFGWDPVAFGVDPLPANVQLDVDANGSLDNAFTIGRSNFQGGVKLCGTSDYLSGGGPGSGRCDPVDHVGGGGQDHQKSSHKNYVSASGDKDGDGIPDDCVCPDENKDGINDETGEPCDEPTEGDVSDGDATADARG